MFLVLSLISLYNGWSTLKKLFLKRSHKMNYYKTNLSSQICTFSTLCSLVSKQFIYSFIYLILLRSHTKTFQRVRSWSVCAITNLNLNINSNFVLVMEYCSQLKWWVAWTFSSMELHLTRWNVSIYFLRKSTKYTNFIL